LMMRGFGNGSKKTKSRGKIDARLFWFQMVINLECGRGIFNTLNKIYLYFIASMLMQ
jgi:hypothetical protein